MVSRDQPCQLISSTKTGYLWLAANPIAISTPFMATPITVTVLNNCTNRHFRGATVLTTQIPAAVS